MRHIIIALLLLFGAVPPALADPGHRPLYSGASIGFHLGFYPDLVLAPGHPVYYAPQLQANYFFYDGYYWLFHRDRWHVSDWYDGPWEVLEPDEVPLAVLRVPVRYYLAPPVYFVSWSIVAAPLWHIHWGPRWTRYHPGWDRYDHRVVYVPAPLPRYQRLYVGSHYPRGEDRHRIREVHYRYRPHDADVRRHEPQRFSGGAPGRWRDDHGVQRPSPQQPAFVSAPRAESAPRGVEPQRATPAPDARPRREADAPPRSQAYPRQSREQREDVRPQGQPREPRENVRPQDQPREQREDARPQGQAREQREQVRPQDPSREQREHARPQGQLREQREDARPPGQSREQREYVRPQSPPREQREDARVQGQPREPREHVRPQSQPREQREHVRPQSPPMEQRGDARPQGQSREPARSGQREGPGHSRAQGGDGGSGQGGPPNRDGRQRGG